jgi:hypothetical protein
MTSQTDSVELIINLIKSIHDWDGETTQYLLEKIGMDEQMLRQLMLSKDPKLVNLICEEHDCFINKNIKHRLAMVLDDVRGIRQDLRLIDGGGMFEDTITKLNNIEIACDFESDECLTWTLSNEPEPITMDEKLTAFYKEIDKSEEYFTYDDFVGTCHINTNDTNISYDLTPFWEGAKGIPINVNKDDENEASFLIAWEYPETDEDLAKFKEFYRWYINYLIFQR